MYRYIYVDTTYSASIVIEASNIKESEDILNAIVAHPRAWKFQKRKKL
jgi:hypothetical protein